MKHSLLCAAVAFLAGHGFADDADLKTATLPPKQYNVAFGTGDQRGGGRYLIGTIALQENASIVAAAEKIEITDAGVATLTGKARVDVMVGGKAAATFSADSAYGQSYLVLTPWVDGSRPIDWRETNKFIAAYDEAIKARDAAKLTDAFAPDARITLEEVTATGTSSKDMNRAEYVKFIQSLAPNALKVEVRVPGNYGTSSIAEDGRSVTGTHPYAYDFTLPYGTLTFAPVQTYTLARGEKELRITTLTVKIPEPDRRLQGGPTTPPLNRPGRGR